MSQLIRYCLKKSSRRTYVHKLKSEHRIGEGECNSHLAVRYGCQSLGKAARTFQSMTPGLHSVCGVNRLMNINSIRTSENCRDTATRTTHLARNILVTAGPSLPWSSYPKVSRAAGGPSSCKHPCGRIRQIICCNRVVLAMSLPL
jgi:hypothetical protein